MAKLLPYHGTQRFLSGRNHKFSNWTRFGIGALIDTRHPKPASQLYENLCDAHWQYEWFLVNL